MSADPIALLGALISRAILEGKVHLPSDEPEALRFSLYNTIKRVRRLLKSPLEAKTALEEMLREWGQVQVCLTDTPTKGLAIVRLDRSTSASKLMEAMTKTEEGQKALDTLAKAKQAEINEALESQQRFLKSLGITPEAPPTSEPAAPSPRAARFKPKESRS